MIRGVPRIDGFSILEFQATTPDHQAGATLELGLAWVRRREDGRVETLGRLPFTADPGIHNWPDDVRAAFVALVDALETHIAEQGNLLEAGLTEKEVLHAVVDGPAAEAL